MFNMIPSTWMAVSEVYEEKQETNKTMRDESDQRNRPITESAPFKTDELQEVLQTLARRLQHRCETHKTNADREKQQNQFLKLKLVAFEGQRRLNAMQMERVRSEARNALQENSLEWKEYERTLIDQLAQVRTEKNARIKNLEEQCDRFAAKLRESNQENDELRIQNMKQRADIRNLEERYKTLKQSTDIQFKEFEENNQRLHAMNELRKVEIQRIGGELSNYKQMETALDQWVESIGTYQSTDMQSEPDRNQHKQQMILLELQQFPRELEKTREELRELKSRIAPSVDYWSDKLSKVASENANLKGRIHDLEALVAISQHGRSANNTNCKILALRKKGSLDEIGMFELKERCWNLQDAVSRRDMLIAKLEDDVQMLKMEGDRKTRFQEQSMLQSVMQMVSHLDEHDVPEWIHLEKWKIPEDKESILRDAVQIESVSHSQMDQQSHGSEDVEPKVEYPPSSVQDENCDDLV